jgi:hypothetical protein
LLGLTLLREDMSEAVGFAGMPKAPFVHHSFSPRDRPQQVLAELGAYAAAHGWRQEVALSDDTTWVGRKDVHGPNVASLIIHLEGIDGRHTTASEGEAVSVFLDYY